MMSKNKQQAWGSIALQSLRTGLFMLLVTVASATPVIAADSQAQNERTLAQQYLSVLPVLILIVLLIVGLAFLIKKLNPTLGRGNPLMRVLGTLPLGGKERLILVQAGDACLLLGVTPGQIQTLHVVNKDSLGGETDLMPAGIAAGGFAGILQAVIKR
jgi:flagellar protein FliO/FliZ